MKRNQRVDSAHTRNLSRREFIVVGAGAAALSMLGRPQSVGTQPLDGWNQGQLAHLIPTASHERFLIKASFKASLTGTNITCGTLRWGKLLEAVFYDCRRYVDYKGDHAKVLPQWVEDWLIARTRSADTTHFFHAPSLPFAYSSGKLGDWYPNLLDDETGRLVLYQEKAGWQRGWFAQHQRLIEALAAQTGRAPVIVQGDFHASAVGTMVRSGELALAQPVHVVMTGTLGTGDMAFPSAFRSVESKPSQLVGMDEALKPTEKNGFTVIDVTPDKLTFTMFMWRPPQLVAEIDTMKPALVYEVPRKA